MKTFKQPILPFVLAVMMILAEVSCLYASEGGLTLDRIIEISLRANPSLSADRDRIERDRQMITVERSPEDPVLEIGFDDQPVSSLSLGRGMSKNFKITQSFPAPGKRRLRGRVAESMSEVTAAVYRGNRQSLVRDVRENYYMLFMASSERKIVEKSVAILKGFGEVITGRYRLGLASQSDIVKLGLEIEKMKNELITIKRNEEVLTAKLNFLMGRKEGEKIAIELAFDTGEIAATPAKLYEIASRNNPDLLASEKMVEKNAYGVELARLSRRPDFMVSAQYSNMRGGMEENRWSVMVGVTLPINRRKINSQIEAAKAEMRSSAEMKKNMENDVYRMITEERSYVNAQNELIKRYSRTILPAANQSVKAAAIAYQNSQTDYTGLVMSVQDLYKYDIENVKAYVDYLVHLNMLERIVGAKVERGNQNEKQ